MLSIKNRKQSDKPPLQMTQCCSSHTFDACNRITQIPFLAPFLFSLCAGLQGDRAHRFLGVDILVPKRTLCPSVRKNRRPRRGDRNHPGGEQHLGHPLLRGSGQTSQGTVALPWAFLLGFVVVASLRKKHPGARCGGAHLWFPPLQSLRQETAASSRPTWTI